MAWISRQWCAPYSSNGEYRAHPIDVRPEEPNGESLNAAAEADSFMASGKTGRFTNGHDLLEAAMR